MSEVTPTPKPFTPTDVARIAMRNRPAPVPETTEDIPLPKEGGIYEKGGRTYRFVPATYTVDMPDRNSVGGFREEQYRYSLRTWFSHTSETPSGKYINGPGWDSRLSLPRLSAEEQLRRYGHAFSRNEIDNPMGDEDWETGKITGGMPDDIPYFELEPIQK